MHSGRKEIIVSWRSKREKLLKKRNSWTQKHGSYPEGDPELHDYVGTLFFHGKCIPFFYI